MPEVVPEVVPDVAARLAAVIVTSVVLTVGRRLGMNLSVGGHGLLHPDVEAVESESICGEFEQGPRLLQAIEQRAGEQPNGPLLTCGPKLGGCKAALTDHPLTLFDPRSFASGAWFATTGTVSWMET